MLELGCGDGGNVLSMAQSLVASSFVGIDAAAAAISRGRKLACAASLSNVDLRVADLEALPEKLGSFDYVIAHGVYSWIPPRARGALLACCRRHMEASGIAYVSYNAYPGSYLRDMTRDILRFHVNDSDDPQMRLGQARSLMETIVAIDEPSPYARVLREQLERMLSASDALLFHDDLAEVSTPFYFHEFIGHATEHGLRFLSEADLFESRMRDVPASAGELMSTLPDDVLVREQYADFFKNRMFRQTLVCHAEAPVRRELDDRDLEQLVISSPARSEQPPAAREAADAEQTFTTPDGFSMKTSEPLVRAAMHALAARWPATVSFEALLEHSRRAVDAAVPTELVAARLRAIMLDAYIARVVLLHGAPPPVTPHAGDRPIASALARAQCAAGAPVVSSLLHTNARLDGGIESALLPLLDGTHDRGRLARAVARAEADVDAALARLAAVGLLHA